MFKIKHLTSIFAGLLVCIFMMSAVSNQPTRKNEVKAESAVVVPNKGDSDMLKYKNLKAKAEELKGEKLTFKEKVALKVFGKKIKTIQKHESKSPKSGKSQVIALVLCFFLGGLGIHRFYLGYTWQGIVQLLTAGGCGIWVLIDFIRIITGDLQPANGAYEKTL
ncbi:MAG: TM2 domain-containing protein [Bernardetiaceae bacterium]|nr:TM2 domain-containing protein [Bernardetiaceae bacterium]